MLSKSQSTCLEGFWSTFCKPFDRAFPPFRRDAIGKHACFRQMCNSFFIDLVSTLCFKDNSPPQKDVIEALLSLLFVQKELLRDAPQSRLLSSYRLKNSVRHSSHFCMCAVNGELPFSFWFQDTVNTQNLCLRLMMLWIRPLSFARCFSNCF